MQHLGFVATGVFYVFWIFFEVRQTAPADSVISVVTWLLQWGPAAVALVAGWRGDYVWRWQHDLTLKYRDDYIAKLEAKNQRLEELLERGTSVADRAVHLARTSADSSQ